MKTRNDEIHKIMSWLLALKQQKTAAVAGLQRMIRPVAMISLALFFTSIFLAPLAVILFPAIALPATVLGISAFIVSVAGMSSALYYKYIAKDFGLDLLDTFVDGAIASYNSGISQAEVSQAEVSQAEVSQAEVSQAEVSQAEVSQAEVSQAEVSKHSLFSKNRDEKPKDTPKDTPEHTYPGHHQQK